MSASIATLLASTVVTTLVAFGVRTTLDNHFNSFWQGWRTLRFAFGLSLSLLRLVIVLVFGLSCSFSFSFGGRKSSLCSHLSAWACCFKYVMTVLSGLYSSNDVASKANSLYRTVSSKIPLDRCLILPTSAGARWADWNVFITVLSLTVICLAKCSFHSILISSSSSVMASPMAFLYLLTKGWKVWNQLTRPWPLYLKRNEPKTDRSASASVHERVVAR